MYFSKNEVITGSLFRIVQEISVNVSVSKKVAPAGQLSEPKLELQLSNRDKTKITNYKHHRILKLGQINSKLQYTNLKQD
jgi:hypothetical protein